MVSEDWECGECGTLVDRPGTRACPTCDGINFDPFADHVPDGERSSMEATIELERALDQLADADPE